jgi:hypothetical protein
MKRSAFALVLIVAVPALAFAAASPFERLAGSWTGNGIIEMADGHREPLRCRAAYDVLRDGVSLELNIRCASESYNFDLRSSAKYDRGRITGVWSESTMNTGGQLSGRAEGDRIHVMANSQTFTAALTLVTNGQRQTVSIQSRLPDSKVKGASMTLSRND